MSTILVGIAGWTFDGWRGTFYPEGLKQKDELRYASRQLRSIEINGTFYSLFKPSSYLSWYEQTPADFNFSIKAPKYITHERRLKEFQTPLANFLASGILGLAEKLGCILWQFPPTMPFTLDRFEPFFAALPHDLKSAAKLGEGHSDWLSGRTSLTVKENLRLRHAVEGRHESFRDPVFVELARKHGIAIVVGDTAGRWPLIEDVTSDFMYLRLHADEIKYPIGYTKPALEYWGQRCQQWSSGAQPVDAAVVLADPPSAIARTVLVYFDNDAKETAPLNALSMISYLTQRGALSQRVVDGLPAAGAIREKILKAKKLKKKSVKKSPAKKALKKAAKKSSPAKASKQRSA